MVDAPSPMLFARLLTKQREIARPAMQDMSLVPEDVS
jgi:hypothetical protein